MTPSPHGACWRETTQEYKEVSRAKVGDTGITLIPNEANLFVWGAQLNVCVCV